MEDAIETRTPLRILRRTLGHRQKLFHAPNLDKRCNPPTGRRTIVKEACANHARA